MYPRINVMTAIKMAGITNAFAQRAGLNITSSVEQLPVCTGKADHRLQILLKYRAGKGVLFSGKYRVLLLCRRIREP